MPGALLVFESIKKKSCDEQDFFVGKLVTDILIEPEVRQY